MKCWEQSLVGRGVRRLTSPVDEVIDPEWLALLKQVQQLLERWTHQGK